MHLPQDTEKTIIPYLNKEETLEDLLNDECRTGFMKKLLGILVLSATKLRPSRLYQVSKRQKSVVARDGIEPPTQAFSGLCSTD